MGVTSNDLSRTTFPMAAGATILPNDTVALITSGPGTTSSGYAVAGQVSTTLRAKGIATGNFYDAYGNKLKLTSPTSTPGNNVGGADGAIWVEVELSMGKNGIRAFPRFNGTGADACTQADVGSKIYMLDNVTMSRLSAGKSAGGELLSFNGDGSLNVVFPLGGY
jgi:hypothetical protein